MLRPYSLYHRPLLGRMCQAAYQTAREMISVAPLDDEPLRPGMIAVVQILGDDLGWHPHVHALVTRGGWDCSGARVPVPLLNGDAATLDARVLRHRWAEFIRRIYEVDPLTCPRCGGTI